MQNEREMYDGFTKDMILRDYLACDRTRLANERTLLAYFRTFVGFFASGAGLIKVFDDIAFTVIGSILMAVSPLFLVLGFVTFIKIRKKLGPLERESSAAAPSGTKPKG